jgi:transcriptional regulator with XRE-family HTH domain
MLIVVHRSVIVKQRLQNYLLLFALHKKGCTELSTIYNSILSLCQKNNITGSKLCSEIGISKATLTELKSGRQKTISATTAQKIADYFGVTVGYLLGEEDASTEARPITDDDLMYALFDGKATPEQLEEVKRFAAYVKARDGE